MRAVSYLAPQLFPVYQAICDVIGKLLSTPICLIQANCDPLEDPFLLNDNVDFAFICGLPLARLIRSGIGLEAMVAPVMDSPRYANEPVYFADFIVHSQSGIRSFYDVLGHSFAVNDFGSNSGYHLPRHYFWTEGFVEHLFGEIMVSGAHSTSIKWVLERRVDCAAIDSVVLDHTLRITPHIAEQLKIIGSTSACAVPPLAVNSRHSALRRWIQNVLVHPTPALQTALTDAGIKRLAPVHNSAYRSIVRQFDLTNNAGYELWKSRNFIG